MTEKPKPPYPDFPLFPHAAGQWAKKIKGRMRYFGVWSDPDAALAKYLAQRDELQAGRTPTRGVGLSVYDLTSLFLAHKEGRMETGELSPRTFEEYKTTSKRMCRVFGKLRDCASLGPTDFDVLRADIAKTRKAVALSTEVQRCRSIFKFGVDSGLLASPVKMGVHFSKASKKMLREARNRRAQQFLSAGEIGQLLASGTIVFRAMVLLGVNAAFGQTDIAKLELSAIDLDSGWVRFPRPKTGIPRDCPLWPETIAAVRDALERRGPPIHVDEDRAFITQQGYEFVRYKPVKGGRIDSVAQAFSAAAKRAGIKRAGVGFYALRHTFRTVADEVRDPHAIKRIMGHSDDDPTDEMRSIYVEEISEARLMAVAEHVRQRLFAGPWPLK